MVRLRASIPRASETGSHRPKGVISLTSKEVHVIYGAYQHMRAHALASRFLQYCKYPLPISKPMLAPNIFPILNSLQLTDSPTRKLPCLLVSLLSPLYTHCFLYSLTTSCLQVVFSLFPSLYALDSSLPFIYNRNVSLSHTMEQPCLQFIQLPGQIVYEDFSLFHAENTVQSYSSLPDLKTCGHRKKLQGSHIHWTPCMQRA